MTLTGAKVSTMCPGTTVNYVPGCTVWPPGPPGLASMAIFAVSFLPPYEQNGAAMDLCCKLRTADPSASLGMTKGRVALPLGVMAVMKAPQPSFIPSVTCRWQVQVLLMTQRGLVPRLRRSDPLRDSISQPFRAGLTFGPRPSGPCIHGDLAVISPSACLRQICCPGSQRVGGRFGVGLLLDGATAGPLRLARLNQP